jgi:outer membrane immunogenic protein
MHRIATAILISIFAASSALAADLELPKSPPSAPSGYFPAVSPVNWSGIYVGVNGGYAFGNSNWSNAGVSTGNFNTQGALVGGTLGINYTTGLSGFLVGLEGDFDWSWLSGASSTAACVGIGAAAGMACATKANWLSTGRLRVGYVLNRVLLFGTGGAAISDTQVGLTPGTLQSVAGPQLGWTAGGGIEYAITDDWTAKAEYLYVNFGTTSCPAMTNCGALISASISRAENVVRGGINYKFTW